MARSSRGVYARPIEDLGRSRRPRWQIVVVAPSGERHVCTGNTQDHARDAAGRRMRKLGASLKAGNLTISAAVELFVDERWRRDVWSPQSLTRARQDLAVLAQPPQTPLRDVDEAFLHGFLDRMSHMEFASQRSRWGTASGFFKWAIARRLIDAHPMRHIDRLDKPWTSRRARRIGRRTHGGRTQRLNSGKQQLQGHEEAGKYLAAALGHPTALERVGAALPLLTAMASGEVRHMQVRDLEFSHRRIWIRPAVIGLDVTWRPKAESRERLVTMPAVLVDDLMELAEGSPGDAFVLRSRRNDNGPFNTEWLRRLVRRTCSEAGVTVVCPHGLRGTYSTVLALSGAAAPEIGGFLGHADAGATARRHYMAVPTQQPALELTGAPARVAAVGSPCDYDSPKTAKEEDGWRSGRDLNGCSVPENRESSSSVTHGGGPHDPSAAPRADAPASAADPSEGSGDGAL